YARARLSTILSSAFVFFCYCSANHPDFHSFPTRRSSDLDPHELAEKRDQAFSRRVALLTAVYAVVLAIAGLGGKYDRVDGGQERSEEHTSELQSRGHLVCRLLLEKKKKPKATLHQDKRRQ